mmetsp:Transcript_18234/g.41583  ORF Transcript_18234/g.41583 Transcript_18234/m.41583 type:complete len:210 (-) Transcript_18234:2355-2984(-)
MTARRGVPHPIGRRDIEPAGDLLHLLLQPSFPIVDPHQLPSLLLRHGHGGGCWHLPSLRGRRGRGGRSSFLSRGLEAAPQAGEDHSQRSHGVQPQLHIAPRDASGYVCVGRSRGSLGGSVSVVGGQGLELTHLGQGGDDAGEEVNSGSVAVVVEEYFGEREFVGTDLFEDGDDEDLVGDFAVGAVEDDKEDVGQDGLQFGFEEGAVVYQ